jgi:hypothetical protein
MLGGGVWLYALNRRAGTTLSDIERSLEAELAASVQPASDVEAGGRVGLAYPSIQGVTSSVQ